MSQKIRLTVEDIQNLLGLPSGVSVSRVRCIEDPDAVLIYLDAPDMPTLPKDAEAPIISLVQAREARWALQEARIRCGQSHPNGWECVKPQGHAGKHGYAGIYWD